MPMEAAGVDDNRSTRGAVRIGASSIVTETPELQRPRLPMKISAAVAPRTS
jgi:hypothetical protein